MNHVRGFLSVFRLALGVCLGIAMAPAAFALPYYVSIQPIQVCTDSGATCANPGREVFETATGAIWAQAGVEVRFEDWNVLNSSRFFNLQTGQEFADMFNVPGVKSSSMLTLNMFFVEDINGSGSYFGEAFLGANGIAIGAAAVLATSRLDTIAHEIGHNLGLSHASGANNLMTAGGSRAVPGSVDDIAPNGAGLDFLTDAQIDKALLSAFVRDNPEPDPPPPDPPTLPEQTAIPAPGGLGPVLAGLLAAAAIGWRSRAANAPLPAAA